MNAWCRDAAVLIGCLAGLACASGVAAAPRAVEAFDAGAWQSLRAGVKRPAAVVFSTTDCVHCPAVIERLRHDILRRKLNAALIVVVMDVAPGDSDSILLRHAEYRQADRLFAFSGQAPAIRYAVDPRWRGVTPYVAFLAPKVPPIGVTGPPSSADVDRWALGLDRVRPQRE